MSISSAFQLLAQQDPLLNIGVKDEYVSLKIATNQTTEHVVAAFFIAHCQRATANLLMGIRHLQSIPPGLCCQRKYLSCGWSIHTPSAASYINVVPAEIVTVGCSPGHLHAWQVGPCLCRPVNDVGCGHSDAVVGALASREKEVGGVQLN